MAGNGRASVKDMEKVETSVLLCIARAQGASNDPVRLSRNNLAKEVGVSTYRAGAAAMRLIKHGLVESAPSFSADGGQQANAYALTEMGEWYYRGIQHGMQMAGERSGE